MILNQHDRTLLKIEEQNLNRTTFFTRQILHFVVCSVQNEFKETIRLLLHAQASLRRQSD